ncbi:MAG: guanylate kinase, partial [Bacilli bacterium]|nr:guanylate kinase [Bacilli bacterium]
MIVITGPSASGKTATCLYLQEHFGIRKVVTHTTRAMRVGEKNDVDYHFVTKEE